jgi:predicted small metal-binding protein
MRAKDFIPTEKPRNFVAKNAKMGGAGQHKDKKKAEKQGDVKHKNKQYEEGVGEAFSQAAADRNKIKYQKAGRIGHGVGWKPMSDNPKEISNDIFDHFNNITRLVQYDELKSDHSRHKFVERFFKKYGYPFEVFPDVISLIDQHLADEYAKARKGTAD